MAPASDRYDIKPEITHPDQPERHEEYRVGETKRLKKRDERDFPELLVVKVRDGDGVADDTGCYDTRDAVDAYGLDDGEEVVEVGVRLVVGLVQEVRHILQDEIHRHGLQVLTIKQKYNRNINLNINMA